MHRIAITILLLCAPSIADTVISLPAPASGARAGVPVMSMVHQAMQQSAHARVGMQALDRYANAKQAPYNVYHVQPRGGTSSNLDWDFRPNYWFLYPRQIWGSYSGWGWWGWPGCVIWNVGSPPAGGACRSTVFAVL